MAPDFKRNGKKWLRLSTFVNASFLYKVVDIMRFMLCQRCQPWNVCILFFENAQRTSLWYGYLSDDIIGWEEVSMK